jgi:hypothetical protein
MLKIDYLGYELDEVIRLYGDTRKYEAIYIEPKKKHIIAGSGAKPETACADAQRKIQKHVSISNLKG